MSTVLETGYEIIEQPDFKAVIYIDIPNKRLKVTSFNATDYNKLIDSLLLTAEKSGLSKIWLVCSTSEWINFLSRGFVMEGAAEGYLNGQTGYFMSYFVTGNRRFSKTYREEQKTLSEVLKIIPETNFSTILPKGYSLRKAGNHDVTALSSLFARVFETYPVPVTKPEYLLNAINTKSIFYLVEHRGEIISAASADMDQKLCNAEITDCATLSDYRGQGLMYNLINALESDLLSRSIYCLYSLAIAKSPGIGKVFRKLGYQYRGRLINNCNICANFEDMNLWVKYMPL